MGETFPYLKWRKCGPVIKLYKFISPTNSILLLRIDLGILAVTLILAIWVILMIVRYQSCMEIFHYIWYCALR